MRFSKAAIWDKDAGVYREVTDRSSLDFSHFNNTVKAWISIWLDLVNNDRAVITRRADGTNVITLLEELLKRITDVNNDFDSEHHRLEATLRELLRHLALDPVITDIRYPPVRALKKYGEDLKVVLVAPRHPSDNKLTPKLQNLVRQYGAKDQPSTRKYLIGHVQVATSRLLRALQNNDSYLLSCVAALRAILEQVAPSYPAKLQAYYLSASIASQFMLRGHSPQSLSELHMAPFMADDSDFKGLTLKERLEGLLRDCILPKTKFTVYLRVTPRISHQDVLQPSVQVINGDEIDLLANMVEDTDFRENFFALGDTSLLKVDCTPESFDGQLIPDQFSAALVARTEVSKVLDVLYMLKSTRVSVYDHCLVVTTESTPNGTPLIRSAEVDLFHRYTPAQEDIPNPPDDSAAEVHEPQTGLQRALHWFRKATESHSDESGLLEAWISLEYLAQGLKSSPRDSEIAVIQTYFPHLLAMRLLSREIDYVLWCVQNYQPYKGNLPAEFERLLSTNERDRLAALLQFAQSNSAMQDAVFGILDLYPHVTWEVQLLCHVVADGNSFASRLEELKERFESMFYRVYAVRNEIVHSARMTSGEVPLLRRTFSEVLRELYQELLVAFRHDSTLTLETYLKECRQEYDQLVTDLAGQTLTVSQILGVKYHFRDI